ncbi:MAG: exo-alpha-sialidase [Phycisphaerales bacterium]|nr:exo-alpha-sialidase [Phycisphaerales bacterium]MCB9857364.1 exo-alpha-sialidase [Phycisphaerales bacterium]
MLSPRILIAGVLLGVMPALNLACQPVYLDADALGPLLLLPLSGASEPIVATRRYIFDAIDGRIGHHGVSVAAFDNGDLLAAWYSYEGPDELDGAAIFTARLNHGETQWSLPRMIDGLPDRSANPLLFLDGQTVRLLFAHAPHLWWSASLMASESTDGGETWSAPRDIGAGLGSNVRNPPIRLDDGSWLLPAYSDFWLNGFLLRSTDGVHWCRGATLAVDGENRLLQPAIARTDGDESLLMVARNRGGHRIFAAASDDRGLTWTRPVETEFPNPDSAVALQRLADGSLLMVFNDSATDRAPLILVRSTDGGETWGERQVIAEGDGDYSYPAIVQTPDYCVHVFYSEDRSRIVQVVLEM